MESRERLGDNTTIGFAGNKSPDFDLMNRAGRTGTGKPD